MKIFILNSGSSSVKFQLIETDQHMIETASDRRLASGQVEKIGADDAIITFESVTTRDFERHVQAIYDHKTAIAKIISLLTDHGLVGAESPIEAIGHRVVHGGERFSSSTLMTEEAVRAIEDCVVLAPLHNPHNLKGYYVCRELFPNLPQVGVFDTAFHQTMPPEAFLYALPYSQYKQHQIRRYGFHGVSHRYVAYRYRQITRAPKDTCNLITCHLGNGCSITAIENGNSVDTSMGMTPLEGLVMGTRTGDLDAAVVVYMMLQEELTASDVTNLLMKQSGLYGISGESNDMRQLMISMVEGHARAKLAIDMFCYRLRKYIGAYTAILGRVDALIFTGGIGENASLVREKSCDRLQSIGYEIDREKNQAVKEGDIATKKSRSRIFVIPTNEEVLIARDTYRTILKIPQPQVVAGEVSA
ncbi:MAG: acetate kinase [Acidobacteriia bacterium]|nr:acetate kinase [Terriglobia bacterium]